MVPIGLRAGEVVLSNQDRLSGELAAINADHIVWQSDQLGPVVIPKDRIAALFTSVPLKRPVVDGLCYWVRLEGLDALLQCEDADEGAVERITFRSLRDAVVYSGYATFAHHYEGKMIGVGSLSGGNNKEQDWLVDIDVLLRHYEYRHIIGLRYDAEGEEDESLEEEYEGTYTINWFFSRKTFLLADVLARTDERRNIAERYSFGTGLGYQFWDTAKSAWSTQLGTEYLVQRSEPDPTDPDSAQEDPKETFSSWRLATNYRYRFPRDIAFYLNAEGLQSIDVSEDWEAKVESGFSMPIARGITADVYYEYDFDNTPLSGAEKADTNLRIGFGYQW